MSIAITVEQYFSNFTFEPQQALQGRSRRRSIGFEGELTNCREERGSD